MKNKIHRVEVDFTDHGFDQLERLRIASGHNTRQDLFKTALRLYYTRIFGWDCPTEETEEGK